MVFEGIVTYPRKAVIPLVGLLPREVPEAVILTLDIGTRAVVEGFTRRRVSLSVLPHSTQPQPGKRRSPAFPCARRHHQAPNLHILGPCATRGGPRGEFVEAGVVNVPWPPSLVSGIDILARSGVSRGHVKTVTLLYALLEKVKDKSGRTRGARRKGGVNARFAPSVGPWRSLTSMSAWGANQRPAQRPISGVGA